MADKRNSMAAIIKVTVLLCLFCSIIVSVAAIGLRPLQQQNLVLERNANMLSAAGLLDMSDANAKSRVNNLMLQVTSKLVDLQTGNFTSDVAIEQYDQLQAAKDLNLSDALSPDRDIASIKRREKYGEVFLIVNDDGIESIILPVRGYGLWSTLYGFIALEKDANTIRGLGFYEHGETPGLGGEVDNPKWKAQWRGKKILSTDGQLALSVVKNLNPTDALAINKVDGLSGASLTSRGVNNLVRFWLGKYGYGPFLDKVRSNEVRI